MSDVVIFYTSVLVDEVRTGRHGKRIDSVEGVVRLSSVVLAELLRGVSGSAELKFLRFLPFLPTCFPVDPKARYSANNFICRWTFIWKFCGCDQNATDRTV